jgi:hypothetical protein
MLIHEDIHTRINAQMDMDACTEYKFIADEKVMSEVAWELWQDLYTIRRNEIFLGILQARHTNLLPML